MDNYLKKIQKLKAEGKFPSEPGKLYDAKVAHDYWCRIYSAGECNCDPEITVVQITKENRAETAKRIAEDTAEFRNKMKEKQI
jgi:hypothetical protein